MNAIEMKGVTKNFGSKNVLSSIHLEIGDGEIFGLLGPSGSGKTTIMKLLIGQLEFTGEATIMGMDCHHMRNEIYEKIGISLDDNGFYERLSIRDNLLLYALLSKEGKHEVDEVLHKVGLENDAKTAEGKISKGMRQRLSLAKAILHKPKLLFLDEPTSGLDPQSMRQIHMLIQDLNKQGMTIFLTTHNMEEASKLCHHVALLNEGTICEYGVPAELCRKYNYLDKLTIRTKDDRELQFLNCEESAQPVHDIIQQGLLSSIHSSEPTLESVFLELTGKEMDV